MNYTIWKFDLQIVDEQLVSVPKGARLLHVQAQDGQTAPLQMWAHVDMRQPPVPRRIMIYGTGHIMPPEPGKYLGTAFTHGGQMVWHIYDAGEVTPH